MTEINYTDEQKTIVRLTDEIAKLRDALRNIHIGSVRSPYEHREKAQRAYQKSLHRLSITKVRSKAGV